MTRKLIIPLFKITLTALLVSVCTFHLQQLYQNFSVQAKPSWWSLKGFLKADENNILHTCQTDNLNHLIPDFSQLLRLNEEEIISQNHDLSPYIRYYQTVIAYSPQIAEAHGILGFCYQQQGKEREAISAYQNAIQRNPYFFWFHYNLGVVQFKQRHFQEAEKSFQAALNTRPEMTLKIMAASKIFQQLGSNVPKFTEEIAAGLKSGYENCMLGLTLIQKYDLRNQKVQFPLEKLKPKLF